MELGLGRVVARSLAVFLLVSSALAVHAQNDLYAYEERPDCTYGVLVSLDVKIERCVDTCTQAAPSSLFPGAFYRFSVTGRRGVESACPVQAYVWRFGEDAEPFLEGAGTGFVGPSFSVRFKEAPSRAVRVPLYLAVQGRHGALIRLSKELTLLPGASFSVEKTGGGGLSYRFDASRLSGATAQARYTWKVTGRRWDARAGPRQGLFSDALEAGPVVAYRFPGPGAYRVSLALRAPGRPVQEYVAFVEVSTQPDIDFFLEPDFWNETETSLPYRFVFRLDTPSEAITTLTWTLSPASCRLRVRQTCTASDGGFFASRVGPDGEVSGPWRVSSCDPATYPCQGEGDSRFYVEEEGVEGFVRVPSCTLSPFVCREGPEGRFLQARLTAPGYGETVHAFEAPKTVKVTVEAEGLFQKARGEKYIAVTGSEPDAVAPPLVVEGGQRIRPAFTYAPVAGKPRTYRFDASATLLDGGVKRYTWLVNGRQAEAGGPVLEHGFDADGLALVRLRVQGAGGETAEAAKWVPVAAPPVVDFAAERLEGLTYRFKIPSRVFYQNYWVRQANEASWLWLFQVDACPQGARCREEGGVLFEERRGRFAYRYNPQNPSASQTVQEGVVVRYTFSREGTHAVKLRFFLPRGLASATALKYVDVRITKERVSETPEFSVKRVLGLTYRFRAFENPHVAIYRWDFGDGAAATGLSVQHTFPRPGLYRVRLEAFLRSGETLRVEKPVAAAALAGAGNAPDPQMATTLILAPFFWNTANEPATLEALAGEVRNALARELAPPGASLEDACQKPLEVVTLEEKLLQTEAGENCIASFPAYCGEDRTSLECFLLHLANCVDQATGFRGQDPNTAVFAVTNDRFAFTLWASEMGLSGLAGLVQDHDKEIEHFKAGVLEADAWVVLHEIGHLFGFCEQYSLERYKAQFDTARRYLEGMRPPCSNLYPGFLPDPYIALTPADYPAGVTEARNSESERYLKCPYEEGVFETACPDPARGFDCLGRKIPIHPATGRVTDASDPRAVVGRSFMGPRLKDSPPSAYDCFERAFIRKKLECEAP